MHELIIIGAGPAGITASVYAARKKIKFLLITKNIGGQAALSGEIENYTGYQFITGSELAAKFESHMKQFGIEIRENEEVVEVIKTGDIIEVKTNKGRYESKTLVIASAKSRGNLMFPVKTDSRIEGSHIVLPAMDRCLPVKTLRLLVAAIPRLMQFCS